MDQFFDPTFCFNFFIRFEIEVFSGEIMEAENNGNFHHGLVLASFYTVHVLYKIGLLCSQM